MNKIILLISLLATTLFAELDWACSYEKALEKAEKSNKLVMLMLSKEDCDACWYMENIVFKDDNVVDEIDASFISYYIDIGASIPPNGLTYIGTPTFHFLTADGKKVDRFDGAANVKDFMDVIERVKRKAK